MDARNPIGAAVSMVFGLAAGAVGLVLAGGTVLKFFDIDASEWATAHSPILLDAVQMSVASPLIQEYSVFRMALFAGVYCVVALVLLNVARTCRQPLGTSDDGKSELDLKTVAPRVGSVLEGAMRLVKEAKAGDMFRVSLICNRRHPPNSESTIYGDPVRIFEKREEVRVVQDARGWSVPFRFEVPITAPASQADEARRRDMFSWRLEMVPANALIAFSSGFDIVLKPPSPEALSAEESKEPAGLKAELDALMAQMAAKQRIAAPAQSTQLARVRLRAMTPSERDALRKALAAPGVSAATVKRVAVGCVGVVTIVLALIFSAALIFR